MKYSDITGYNLLKFLNLLDSHNKLSITNLSVYAVLIKIVVSPGSSIEDLGLLLITVLNYSHKRSTTADFIKADLVKSSDDTEKLDALVKQIQTLESTTTALSFQAGMKLK